MGAGSAQELGAVGELGQARVVGSGAGRMAKADHVVGLPAASVRGRVGKVAAAVPPRMSVSVFLFLSVYEGVCGLLGCWGRASGL